MVRIDHVVVTCEHAGNRVPPEFAHLFAGAKKILGSHRGYDPGALELAEFIARRLRCELFAHPITRLLVEPNRSIGHRALFSEFTKPLPHDVRRQLVDRYYFPHRDAVEAAIAAHVRARKRVLHLGVHTFTPELNGVERKADIGLLYDPNRKLERAFCDAWDEQFATAVPELRIRRNYPYRGAADGFTTFLRRQFPATRYLGIELEVNQALVGTTKPRRRMVTGVADSMACLLDSASAAPGA